MLTTSAFWVRSADMSLSIENRPYGPDSNLEDIAALRQRVRIEPNGILFFEEVPMVTTFSVQVMWDQFEDLVAGWERISYVADLTKANRPTAEVRAALKKRVARNVDRYGHVAVVVGENVVI